MQQLLFIGLLIITNYSFSQIIEISENKKSSKDSTSINIRIHNNSLDTLLLLSINNLDSNKLTNISPPIIGLENMWYLELFYEIYDLENNPISISDNFHYQVCVFQVDKLIILPYQQYTFNDNFMFSSFIDLKKYKIVLCFKKNNKVFKSKSLIIKNKK